MSLLLGAMAAGFLRIMAQALLAASVAMVTGTLSFLALRGRIR